MNAEVDFRHIPENEHLLAYVSTKTVEVAEHFLEGQEYHIEVRLDTDRSRSWSRRPHFTCEVILKMGGKKRAIAIKKSGDDFYRTVSKTGDVLRRILRRVSAQSERHRHDRDFKYLRSAPIQAA